MVSLLLEVTSVQVIVPIILEMGNFLLKKKIKLHPNKLPKHDLRCVLMDLSSITYSQILGYGR